MTTNERAPVSTSVVIPTYNRSDQLVRLITALEDQEGIEFDVVVADDGSTDDTVARVRSLGDNVPFPLNVAPSNANTGPAATRNRGWRLSQGRLVVFIDDDCLPAPLWLATLVAGLDHADVVTGRTRPPADQLSRIGPFSRYLDISDGEGFLTCNIAYRREVLDQLGGFDEKAFPLHNGEDTDLGLRAVQAGFRDQYVPAAVVYHDVHPSDFRTHLRGVRHLEGIIALVARHPTARRHPFGAGWFLRSVDKAVLICWAAAAIMMVRPRNRSSWLLGIGGAGTYLWQFRRAHYRPRSRREWATSVPLGFVADTWAVAVMIRGSLRHRTILL